jgi:4-hydroxy-2-oxoheptanedioate aldolase
MPVSTPNAFKQRLVAGERQLGFFSTLGSASLLEVIAGWGFDWVVIDLEHGQSELGAVLEQLRVLEALGVEPVVRPPWNEPVIVKRLLDLGARTLLFPSVGSADEAAQAVAATRYPPAGVRGVSGNSRAAGYGRVPGYLQGAAEQLCVIVQVETAAGLEALDAIATTPGVDGVFIGPSDLSAALDHLGDAQHPEVQQAVDAAFARLRQLGVPAGYLTVNTGEMRRRLAGPLDEQPAFAAVATDVSIVNQGLAALDGAIGLAIGATGTEHAS